MLFEHKAAKRITACFAISDKETTYKDTRLNPLKPVGHQRFLGLRMLRIYLKKVEAEVRNWPRLSPHPDRFGGKEFRCESGEIGHIHAGGALDIPFPKPIRDELLAEGLAQQHRWVPSSGWVTFNVAHGRGCSTRHLVAEAFASASQAKSDFRASTPSRKREPKTALTPALKSLMMQLLPVTSERTSSRAQINAGTVY